MKSMALILIMSFLSSICYSQDLVSPIISPVKKGKLVPFDGMLYNYEADSVIQEEINSAEKICTVKNEYAIKMQQANCDSDKKQSKVQCDSSNEAIKIQLDTCFKDVTLLNDVIKKPIPPLVLSDPNKHWWILLGIGIGAALTGGSLYLVKKLQ